MEELIKTLEEIKEHQMQTVQLARTTTVYKLADKAINQALSLSAFVGQSEVELCECNYPLIRTGTKERPEYCGICEKDI